MRSSRSVRYGVLVGCSGVSRWWLPPHRPRPLQAGMRCGEPPRVGCHRRTTWVPRPRRSRSSSACCCACATRPAPKPRCKRSQIRPAPAMAGGCPRAAFDSSYAPARADRVRRAGLASLAGLPCHQDVAQRDATSRPAGRSQQVEQTFAPPGAQLLLPGQDRTGQQRRRCPCRAARPAAVSGAIAGVIGIDQGSTLKQPADTQPGPPPGARYGVPPCSSYYGQKIADRQATRPTARRSHTWSADTCPSSTSRPTGRRGLLASG